MDKNASGKIKYYGKILKRYQNVVDFYTSSQKLLKNMPKDLSYEDSVIYETSVLVTAPVLISYVIYILKDAQRRGIQRLYFLSRDGYIMYKIAEVICNKYKIKIDCRYLYVSRLVLREPLYFIDKNEAMKYFCEYGVRVSPKIVLKRAGISCEMQDKILNEIDVKFKEKLLTKDELIILGEKLKNNECFIKEALEHSKSKYKIIYEYFVQEGLTENRDYAIVDVGWLGSMQRNIRQILSYAGDNRTLCGYYFGMFENGKVEDGEYNCFYFSKEFNSSRRVFFNNNLFECMCSANHGMTVGYKKNNNNSISAVFSNQELKWNVNLQLNTVEKFTELFVSENEWNNILIDKLSNLTQKLLKSFMIFPSIHEATVYGSIPFADDPSESYMLNLAEKLTNEELWQYNIFYKIYRNIFLKNKQIKYNESFWINGTIKLSNISCKKLFNLSCLVCEYLHYLKLNKVN